MKSFTILLLLCKISLGLVQISPERAAFWRSEITRSQQLSDLDAYLLLTGALSATDHSVSPYASGPDPVALEIYREVQEILIERSGFAKPVVDKLMETHLAAIHAVRNEKSDPLEDFRVYTKAIGALRRVNTGFSEGLKWIPSPEMIRQIGRLYSLPRWTEEEFLQLEGPEFGNTYADSIKTADLVFDTLIERDERRKQISKDTSGLSHSEIWGVWFQDIASGKESFRFKGQKELVNLRSRKTSDPSPHHPRQGNGRNPNSEADDDNEDAKPPLSHSTWIFLSFIGATIIAFIIWRIYGTSQAKH